MSEADGVRSHRLGQGSNVNHPLDTNLSCHENMLNSVGVNTVVFLNHFEYLKSRFVSEYLQITHD